MPNTFELKIIGVKEFEAAIKRNPAKSKIEIKKFLIEAIAEYNRGIMRNPWRMGQSGGGAPVATGNLRDTHQKSISAFQARIWPTAPYARYVHGDGEKKNKRGVQLRPWMTYVFNSKQKLIDKLAGKMLDNIVADLAK